MAQWHIILEMNNAVKVKDESNVQVYMDGRLVFDKGAVVTDVIGTLTPSPVILKEPPAAKVLHGYGSTPLFTAGYSWMYPNGDGKMEAILTDHAHPLDWKELLKPISVKGHYVKLAFEDGTDFIEVRCWPDTQWNHIDAIGESLTCEGSVFDIKKGGYIPMDKCTGKESFNNWECMKRSS